MNVRTVRKKRSGKVEAGKILINDRVRFGFLLGVFFLLFLMIFFKLWTTQVASHEHFSDSALRQHAFKQELVARRGTIYFSDFTDQTIAAVNREYYLAYLSPRDVTEDERASTVAVISQTFDLEQGYVEGKMNKRDDVYEVLKHRVSKEDRDRISEQNIPGLAFLPEIARYYPAHHLASQVVGFMSSDGEEYIGTHGIEKSFEDILRGEHGWREQKADARGGWLSVADRTVRPQHDGADLRLTIDRSVQQEVEKILAEDTEKYDAEIGSVIVMDPNTGAIIAMAMTPTFSLNEYSGVEDIGVYRNNTISDTYEPGSVFKTFTIAIGLDTGKITPESTYLDTGSVTIGGWPIGNAEGKVYGLQTMTQILEESINTGVVHVERLVGHKKFKEYTERFGFGTKTGISLPAESAGDMRNLAKTNRHTEYATASYGQGITTTQLQLIAAYAALANGGYMMKPQIVAEQIFTDGSRKVMEPQILHRVVSEQVSDEIGLMLEQVVVGGHAKLAEVPGYRVGGKTGTAQIVDATTGTYADENHKNTTFIGYGPIDNPEFVILVKYQNPKNAEWAATSAAPTFGRIAKFLFAHYGIVPTEEIKK